MTLPYPPPYQDLATLAAHLCLGERTVERWVQQGKLPQPCTAQGDKRLWRWKDVEKHLAARRQASAPSDDITKITEGARAALERSAH